MKKALEFLHVKRILMRLNENSNKNFYKKADHVIENLVLTNNMDNVFLKDQSIFKNYEIFILPWK